MNDDERLARQRGQLINPLPDDPYMGKHPCKAKFDECGFGESRRVECGKTDEKKPMCFRGEPWCCNDHRKLVKADTTAAKALAKMAAKKKQKS